MLLARVGRSLELMRIRNMCCRLLQACGLMENAKLWDATLLKHFDAFQDRALRPIWQNKSWQAVWNWNDHNQGHGIALHADECTTYRSSGPIASLSFGRGGVLTLSSFKSQQASKMLFQENGDALVLSGEFQSQFWHGVPERSSWSGLRSLPMYNEMQDWEKRGFEFEVQSHEDAVPGDKHVRMNCENAHSTQPVSILGLSGRWIILQMAQWQVAAW